ncbi:MAG: bifunctional hydroxymethylpyrimidine kinase/phosphomethylpyrimidine kinase [Cypionkella sp.]
MIPNVLAIAGSDPSGGAGIQADLKAISANGGYAMAAITALTAQNTRGVFGVEMVSPQFVAAQIRAVREDIRIDAVKIGMLGTAEITKAVAQALQEYDGPIVIDPVMVAKGGDRLLAADAVSALAQILPMCAILTPNLPEAADLLSCPEAQDRAMMEDQARALLLLGPRAVLLKGGHLAGPECPDLFVTACGQLQWLSAPRIATRNTHGTGCTLSSALATHLALTGDALAAVIEAKAYVTRAIAAADGLCVGHGHGPTDHFPMLRTQR